MVDPKKSFLISLSIGALLIGVSFAPSTVLAASKKQFFDFGPYYSQTQVLGLSLSSLENLPVPQIPAEIIPPVATGLLPGNLFYPLEKAAENVTLAFTFDPVKKEQLRVDFAAERLSEAKTLMDQGKTEEASAALNDYSQTVRIVAQNLSDQTLADKVEEKLTQAAVFTQSIILNSPPVQAENWTAALDAGNQLLDKAAEVKGSPAIPEDLSASIQSLKQDGLISEEETNKLYSFKSRSEVREELDKLVSSGQFPPAELNKLDTAIEDRYPVVQEQLLANMQVAELRTYQSLPQPTKEVLKGLEEWKKDQTQAPPNDIKPYLWYNRAQDLAREVDLSNFPADRQTEVAKFYPAVVDNPTYVPTPTPTVTPTPSPTITQSDKEDQSISPTPSPTPPAVATPTPPSAQLYVGAESGALPGDLNYNIKRWNEDLSLTFTFDPVQKARLKMQQAERRLAEANALAGDPKKATYLSSVIKDYKSALDGASDLLKNAPESPQSREAAKKLESEAARHEVVFEKGLVAVAQDPKLITEVIHATEDAMDRAADAQNRVAVPPVLASRLGDLKAQGLILPEEVDDLTRSDSREQVREKIRKLTEAGTFPSADAKKLDEAQLNSAPSEYNQLVEVRKVEELQTLRSAQADFAQTATLKNTATTLGQKEAALFAAIEPDLITEEDLKGRQDLIKTYQSLKSQARPINSGQFPTPSPTPTPVESGQTGQPSPTPSPTPRRSDAVLSVCPEGATFKQFEGCVWADSGKSLNDYEQYKCDGPRQYYSFAAKKCVPYEYGKGFGDDAQPVCPLGYNWNWQVQSCQTSTGGILPFPTPKPEDIKDEKEVEERSETCPQGASYKAPNGCVWDDNGKKIYDGSQYRCGQRQYYSFETHKCVPAPKEGEAFPGDAKPACNEANTRWSWAEGKCVTIQEIPPEPLAAKSLDVVKPAITPDSPFYTVKQWGDALQLVTSFTPEAKAKTRIAQAKERLTESIYLLEKGDGKLFDKTLASYTAKMQELYNDLPKASMSDTAKKEISERLTQEAVSQNQLLQKAQVLAKADQEAAISAASSAVILGVDRAADLAGEPAVPEDIKAKVEALPEGMVTAEDKKALLEADSRVEARLTVSTLVAKGVLTSQETTFLNEDFDKADSGAKVKLDELKRLEELADAKEKKEETTEKIEKNEKIVAGLNEFQKNWEVGKEIPAEIRPYVSLTRIEEVVQTIRPDIVKLDDFQNRKDVQLAVATLQQEFKPTSQAIQQVADFRRRNPGASLPPDLARVEALSYSLGVRNQAESCFLPSPPFQPNTPCPAAGAAIPISTFIGPRPVDDEGYRPGWSNVPKLITDPEWTKDGWGSEASRLVYGQGPKPESAGVCSSGYHWMYDNGGWCMSNSGNYGISYPNVPSGTGPGYTPYSPYYTAPGTSPATSGYPAPDTSPNDGCPYGSDRNENGNCISSGPSYYNAPNYYGSAPTNYTTNPPAGTVPGSGPKPTAPGQCPSGFHWMSESGGWCMANSTTYVPSGPYSPNLTKESCGPGYYWDGRGCIPTSTSPGSSTPWCWSAFPPPGGWSCGSGSSWDSASCSCKSSGSSANNSSPSSYQYGCTPGSYWDGSKCVAGSYEGSGWSDTAARSQSWCQSPSGGCGFNSYWDYGSCSCRSSSTYSGGGSTYTGTSSSCSPPSGGCGSGWFDYGSCSCKQASSQGCYNVSASSCGSGWYWDSGACTCRQSSSSTGGGTTSTSGSCPSGSHWMSDNGGYCMSDSTSTGSSGSSTSGGSSSGSCPSGYHWMGDNGGWCMSDGGASVPSSTSTSTTSSPAPTTTTETPPASSAPSTSSDPAPAPTTTESAPPPSEPAPAPPPPPADSTTTTTP